MSKAKTVTVRGVDHNTLTSKPAPGIWTFTGPNITADDDYHTFDELYAHRNRLFLTLLRALFSRRGHALWCSKLHHDGSMFEGWFIAGVNQQQGEQITYHLPLELWDETVQWCHVLDRGPEYDYHSPHDVLERLKNL